MKKSFAESFEIFYFGDPEKEQHQENVPVAESDVVASALRKFIGGPGPDNWLGTEGDDLMIGKGSGDHFASLGGDDRLVGGNGGDVLDGGGGDDRLIGGKGGDYLIGELGADTMTGGRGYNQFAFKAPPSMHESGPGPKHQDVITDFDRGFDHLTFVDLPLGDGAGGYDFIGQNEFSRAGEIRYEHAKDGINVMVNMDSDGRPELVVHLESVSKLSLDDFYL